jgi:hypothetical protein
MAQVIEFRGKALKQVPSICAGAGSKPCDICGQKARLIALKNTGLLGQDTKVAAKVKQADGAEFKVGPGHGFRTRRMSSIHSGNRNVDAGQPPIMDERHRRSWLKKKMDR